MVEAAIEGGGNENEAFMLRTGIKPDDLRRLGKVPLFAGFAPNDLRKLLFSSSVRDYTNQTALFCEGESAQRFFVLLNGWVKLYRLCEDGREIVISVVSPGESFAEAAIFDSHVYPVDAMTISDARLLVVSADSMMRELRENMDFTFNMLASMSRQMRCNITLLHQLSAMSSTERLVDFLLSLCDVPQGQAEIILPLDKSLIASCLSMQPETFSRALAKLKNMGVSNEGHNIVIKDVAQLRKIIKHKTPGCC